MNQLGNREKQEVGRWANNRVENNALTMIWSFRGWNLVSPNPEFRHFANVPTNHI